MQSTKVNGTFIAMTVYRSLQKRVPFQSVCECNFSDYVPIRGNGGWVITNLNAVDIERNICHLEMVLTGKRYNFSLL